MWNFVRSSWPYLVSRFSLNDRYLGRLAYNVANDFNTQTQLDEMRDFFSKYPEAGAGNTTVKNDNGDGKAVDL